LTARPKKRRVSRASASGGGGEVRAEELAEDWKQRFEAVLRAAVDAIVVIDERGSIESFNAAAERLFGYSADEVLGKPVNLLVPERYRSAESRRAGRESHVAQEVARIVGLGREVEGLRRDGSVFPIELSVGEARSGTRQTFVGIIRDLSDRRAAEAALLERERLIQAAFDNAPLATLSIGADGRVLRANRAAAEAFGCAPEDLPGERILDLVVPEDRSGLAEMLRSVTACEPQGLGGPEWHYQRRGGELVVGRSHASAVLGTSGEPQMIVLQFEDRTERRRIGQELSRVRDELAHVARLGTVGELATGIAHEINQPLAAISSYAQACRFLIERGEVSPERLSETLQKITDSARRAGDVIQNLRNFLRKRDSERSRVQAEDLVRGVAQLVGVDPRFHDIGLELALDAETSPVVVDRVQLQQVLLNLMLNALDAMEGVAGGRITMKVAQPSALEVLISVRDQGTGITAEIGERVFESYFSTKAAGMGFGLAHSRSIAEAHGGRLWFTSNDGGGTTFHLSLPTAVVRDGAGSDDAGASPEQRPNEESSR
jgi:two-component system sensor kinase FixL